MYFFVKAREVGNREVEVIHEDIVRISKTRLTTWSWNLPIRQFLDFDFDDDFAAAQVSYMFVQRSET